MKCALCSEEEEWGAISPSRSEEKWRAMYPSRSEWYMVGDG